MDFRLGYRPALDGLRAICVLLVMAHHAALPFSSGGFLGVDGFFVLSGFLITSLLMQEWHQRGKVRLSSFYARRALRLFPALFLFLGVCALLTWLSVDSSHATGNWHGIILGIVYLSNWAPDLLGNNFVGLGIVQHTWSLAVEEQFYLLWPIVLIATLKLRSRPWLILSLVLALIAASMIARAHLISNGAWVERVYKGSDTRADSLLVGCLLALLLSFGILRTSDQLRSWTRPLLAVTIPLLVYLCGTSAYWGVEDGALPPQFFYYGGFTLVAALVALLILHLITSPHGRIARVLSWQPLVKVGIISYGLYLWHYLIFWRFQPDASGWLDLPTTIARFALTFLVAMISYHFVERPLLRLKERLVSGPHHTAPTYHRATDSSQTTLAPSASSKPMTPTAPSPTPSYKSSPPPATSWKKSPPPASPPPSPTSSHSL